MIAAASIGLVALDVDGTVLTPDGTVAPSTVAAVAAARAGGVHVVLASSRGPVALERIQDALALRDEWCISYQGALVARESDGALALLNEIRIDSAAPATSRTGRQPPDCRWAAISERVGGCAS